MQALQSPLDFDLLWIDHCNSERTVKNCIVYILSYCYASYSSYSCQSIHTTRQILKSNAKWTITIYIYVWICILKFELEYIFVFNEIESGVFFDGCSPRSRDFASVDVAAEFIFFLRVPRIFFWTEQQYLARNMMHHN